MNRPLVALALVLAATATARAGELPKQHQNAIDNGLRWLARQQDRDGHWEANGGNFRVAVTALAGMAFLMEGSTPTTGAYADNIRRAVDWVQACSRPDGLLVDPNATDGMYMYGHGYALLFLSQVHGEEADEADRKKLDDVLTRAAKFSGKAQTNRGGWGYVSAKDGNDFDEGSVTVTQVQALRAARDAGIAVPQDAIRYALQYLQNATHFSTGGVVYTLAGGGGGDGRPPLTAAAVVCAFCADELRVPLVKRWLKFCRAHIRLPGEGKAGHDEYMHYYYAQVLYRLGEDGYGKLFPDVKPEDRLTWGKYRAAMGDYLVKQQNADGSWGRDLIGPAYDTACFLAILQLDRASLPVYQR